MKCAPAGAGPASSSLPQPGSPDGNPASQEQEHARYSRSGAGGGVRPSSRRADRGGSRDLLAPGTSGATRDHRDRGNGADRLWSDRAAPGHAPVVIPRVCRSAVSSTTYDPPPAAPNGEASPDSVPA